MKTVNFIVGKLYNIDIKGVGLIRIIAMGFRPYYKEKPLYYYDIDNCSFGQCYQNEVVRCSEIDIKTIKDDKLREHLLTLQVHFVNVVESERIAREDWNKTHDEYMKLKEELEKKTSDLNKIIKGFYKIEEEANNLAIDLVNSGFNLENQNNSNKTLSIEEFKDKIWEYIKPELKQRLLSPCRYNLNFSVNTFNEDGGCWYYMTIEREKILEVDSPIYYDSPGYDRMLRKEEQKEDYHLRYLNIIPFAPYEREDMFSRFSNTICYGYPRKYRGTPEGKKKRNYYHSIILQREFSIFPLTEENAKRIGESIYIDFTHF